MVTYEIDLHYEIICSYPALKWKQDTYPDLKDITEIVLQYSIKHKVPKDILEDHAVLCVDAYENGLYTDTPLVYGIDFSLVKSKFLSF